MAKTFSVSTLFFVVLFFALINTGMYIVADKWGIIRWYEAYKSKWMPNKCEYCLFFWMALIELNIWYFLVIPFDWFTYLSIIGLSICSAVISRFFL